MTLDARHPIGLYSTPSSLTEGASGGVWSSGAGTAAPADVPRKRISGRPRVTVRPNYVGLPFSGLDAGRTNGAKAPGSGGRRVRRLDPGSTVPKPKIAAVERRKATRSPLRARPPRPAKARKGQPGGGGDLKEWRLSALCLPRMGEATSGGKIWEGQSAGHPPRGNDHPCPKKESDMSQPADRIDHALPGRSSRPKRTRKCGLIGSVRSSRSSPGGRRSDRDGANFAPCARSCACRAAPVRRRGGCS
jgi:hypothetical protein